MTVSRPPLATSCPVARTRHPLAQSSRSHFSTSSNAPDAAELDALVKGILSADRQALSRAITLIESIRPDHRLLSAQLMTRVLEATQSQPQPQAKPAPTQPQQHATPAAASAAPFSATAASSKPSSKSAKNLPDPTYTAFGSSAAPGPRSMRLGISGPPGVGKSTFIEAIGMYLVGLGHRVAVLSIDPSSTRTGGWFATPLRSHCIAWHCIALDANALV
jgi:LAO/AO transport system kinase